MTMIFPVHAGRLGAIASQSPANVTITGGSITGTVGAAPPLPGYVTGLYYFATALSGAVSTKALTAGRLYLVGPFAVGTALTITELGLNVDTGTGNAGDNARIGIYKDTGGVPTTLIVDGGEVAINTSGAKTLTISQALTPGSSYWLGVNAEANVTLSSSGSTTNTPRRFGLTATSSQLPIIKLTQAYGALPVTIAPTSSDFVDEAPPLMWFRK